VQEGEEEVKVEITDEEVHELCEALMLAAGSPDVDMQKVNWEVISKFLAKIDKKFLNEGGIV
jgi:hypothetical protein